MPTADLRREIHLRLGGHAIRQVGVVPFIPEGDDVLNVFYRNTDFTISESGIYIVSSSVVRTATLPALSSLTTYGIDIVIKRHGIAEVDIETDSAADEIEPGGGITALRLFTNWSALALFGHPDGTYWYEKGFYGGVIE